MYLVDHPSGLPTKSGTESDRRARTVVTVSAVIFLICRDPPEGQKISYLAAWLVVLAFGVDTSVVVHVVLPAVLGSVKELTSVSTSAEIVHRLLDKAAGRLRRRGVYAESV